MNYSELSTQLQQTTEVSEATFVTNIPNFVRRTEERIYRYIKLPKLRKVNTSLATSIGVRTITVPNDFLSVDSFSIISGTTYTHLVPKEPDFVREAYGSTSYTSRPLIYALRDNETIILGPTPDAVYQLELVYTHKPESIVTASTTWIGDNAENALFSGCMVEALAFLKGEQMDIDFWNQKFMEAVGVTKVLGEGKDRTDEWRNSPPRSPNAVNQ